MATNDSSEMERKKALLAEYQRAFWPEILDMHVLLTLAESYLKVGMPDESIILLEIAVRRNSACPLAYIRLAESYQQLNKLEAAALAFAGATQCDPANEFDGANMIRGMVDELTDHSRALEILRQVSSRFPNDLYFAEMLAEFAHRYGEYVEAERIYRSLLAGELQAEQRLVLDWRLSGVLIDNGNYAEGFPLIERVLPQMGDEYDIELIERNLADDYLKAGRFEPALKIHLHRVDSFSPGKSRAEMLRKAAKCYEGTRKHDQAIKCLIEILTFIREVGTPEDTLLERGTIVIDPSFYEDIYTALTRCYEASGDFVRAKEAFRMEKAYFARGQATPKPATG